MFQCTHYITINEAFRNFFVILISIYRCFIGLRNIVAYRLNDGIDIFVVLKQESTFGVVRKALVEVCVQLKVLFTILRLKLPSISVRICWSYLASFDG